MEETCQVNYLDNDQPISAGFMLFRKILTIQHPSPLRETRDNGVFNWTMTYKRSSDIWAPYGSYRKKNIDDRKNYNSGVTDEQQKTFLRVVRNAVNN